MKSAHPQPRYLILPSGGAKGVCILGALIGAEAKWPNLLRPGQIKGIAGCSIGAVLGFLLTIGLSLSEIFIIASTLPSDCISQSMMPWLVTGTFGVMNIAWFEHVLQSAADMKGFSHFITFAQLFQRTGVDFRVTVSSVMHEKLLVHSASATPTLSVLQSVRASASIPMIMPPVLSPCGTDYWVDGGHLEAAPLMAFAEDDATEENEDDSLVLAFTFAETSSVSRREPPSLPTSILDYMWRVMYLPMNVRHEQFVHSVSETRPNMVMIELYTGDTSAFSLQISLSQVIKLMGMGLSSWHLGSCTWPDTLRTSGSG